MEIQNQKKYTNLSGNDISKAATRCNRITQQKRLIMRILIKGCVIYGTFYPMTFEIFRNSRNLTRGYYRSIFSTVHNYIQVSSNTKRNIDVKNPYATLTIRKIDRNISKSLCNCFNKSINSVRNEPSFFIQSYFSKRTCIFILY